MTKKRKKQKAIGGEDHPALRSLDRNMNNITRHTNDSDNEEENYIYKSTDEINMTTITYKSDTDSSNLLVDSDIETNGNIPRDSSRPLDRPIDKRNRTLHIARNEFDVDKKVKLSLIMTHLGEKANRMSRNDINVILKDTMKLKRDVSAFMKVKAERKIIELARRDQNIKEDTMPGLQKAWAAMNTKKKKHLKN